MRVTTNKLTFLQSAQAQQYRPIGVHSLPFSDITNVIIGKRIGKLRDTFALEGIHSDYIKRNSDFL